VAICRFPSSIFYLRATRRATEHAPNLRRIETEQLRPLQSPPFKQRGIDVDDYARPLSSSLHNELPDGIHPNGYNQDWQQWIDQNPDATAEDCFNQLKILESKYGLEPLPGDNF
jgi:hypothetical protein